MAIDKQFALEFGLDPSTGDPLPDKKAAKASDVLTDPDTPRKLASASADLATRVSKQALMTNPLTGLMTSMSNDIQGKGPGVMNWYKGLPPDKQKMVRMIALTTAGAEMGGAIGPAAEGLGGMMANTGLRALGSGAGSIASDIASREKPNLRNAGAMAALEGAGGALQMGAKGFQKAAPWFMQKTMGVPESATKMKIAEKTLPVVSEAESTTKYGKALEKAGVKTDVNADIDRLAEQHGRKFLKADTSSMEAGTYLKNLEKPGAKIDPAQLQALRKQVKMSLAVDVNPFTDEGIAKNAHDLRTLQSIAKNPDLTKEYGESELMKDSLDLRKSLDNKIKFQPTTGAETSFKKGNQARLKEMRGQLNEVITGLPKGNIIRSADKTFGKEVAGRTMSQKFARPNIYRLGGMGAMPFLLKRLGVPYPAGLALAAGMQSPYAMGNLAAYGPEWAKALTAGARGYGVKRLTEKDDQ
jgi:hypothetical protein